MIVLFWVDNYICYSQNDSSIDKLIVDLKDDFLLEKRKTWQQFWVYRLIDQTKEQCL